MAQPTLRVLAFVNHFMIFLSSAIVTGVISYLLSKFGNQNSTHIIYQEVIATITLALWTFGMVLPFVRAYGGHLWPVNLILSYLWLTSLVFSAQDWTGGRCRVIGPGFDRCGLKRTAVAFNFLAFIFLLANTVIEAALFRTHYADRTRSTATHKEGPNTSAAGGMPHTNV
ncbi:MARVEL-like domain protein [Metarhizium rileyi]|uniref:MARVEL-like domain protein n=1 Tax=Metarhizium rileyi (strain RCEF 4871) TaxID=1649241 RepID=A0A167B759_METRR|nr:MARVEL-like domain protein [Metarhizium rileyi RCEF 4871]